MLHGYVSQSLTKELLVALTTRILLDLILSDRRMCDSTQQA